MADVPPVFPIDFQTLRDALGKDEQADRRVETLILLALHGPVTQRWIRDRTGISAPGVKQQVETLEALGLAEVERSEGRHPLYRATPVGVRIGQELEVLRRGSLAGDLLGRVIVCATRAPARSNGSLRAAMVHSSRAVFTGYGSLQYVGICDDDPGLVEALAGRLDELGSEPQVLRVSEIVMA